jgi:hypothetical protein
VAKQLGFGVAFERAHFLAHRAEGSQLGYVDRLGEDNSLQNDGGKKPRECFHALSW